MPEVVNKLICGPFSSLSGPEINNTVQFAPTHSLSSFVVVSQDRRQACAGPSESFRACCEKPVQWDKGSVLFITIDIVTFAFPLLVDMHPYFHFSHCPHTVPQDVEEIMR